jgi:cyclopropane-fatty-acyl-phospholipid synthase
MEWRERFEAHRAEIVKLYDERFCRMWTFYLAGAEMSFRHLAHVVFQVQIAKRVDALPVTRDYMVDLERAIGATIGYEPPARDPETGEPSLPRRVA